MSGGLNLTHVASIVLALATGGCCNTPDETWHQTLEGTFMGQELDELRAGTLTNEARCEAACGMLATADHVSHDDIRICTATAIVDGGDGDGDTDDGSDGDDLPTWDPAQTEVAINCRVSITMEGFCTGRRPLGHRDLAFVGRSRAAWFAEQAYLERASVTAFDELAAWLVDRSAPDELIQRCRAAAADEVVHADRLTALAQRDSCKVPDPSAEPGSDDLLAVALHNAVEGCVRESFGALLGAYQARNCADAELCDLFARIAADELRHGQLAWDLHVYFLGRLDEAARAQLEAAQLAALDQLAQSTALNAMRTPAGLGWPPPEQAAHMAEHFAAVVRQQLAAHQARAA